MNFKEFVELTRPVIGGKSGAHKYVRSLFDAILTDGGRDILDDYSESTYKAYANGNTQITKIAKAMSPHLDQVEFASFIYEAEESAQLELCERFKPYLPGINVRNVGDEIADLFAGIIREAAGAKRKSTLKQGAVANEETDAHTKLEEKVFASGQAMADAWKQVVAGLTGENDASTPTFKITSLSSEDKESLNAFRSDTKEILRYIIDNDPAAGPTVVYLSDHITEVIQKWQLRYREIENRALRTTVSDILRVLGEYTYYISDVFLRYVPERNVLWFRNESLEEGNRLRDVLQPKSYELRCKIARLYETLYPLPEDEPIDAEHITAEVVDDEESSGVAPDDKKTTVIQQQINVIQNGEKNINLTNNGTINFNF